MDEEEIDYLRDAKNLLDEADTNLVESDYWSTEGNRIKAKILTDIAKSKYKRVNTLALIAIADELREMNANLGALGPQQ